VEAIPRDGADPAAIARILERFGEPTSGSPKSVAVLLERGAQQLAEVVRALDSAGVEVEQLQLHAPSLNDVFLAKTGRSLEGAEEEAEEEE
jgi:ABC-2 type transport system ATP-binding protein